MGGVQTLIFLSQSGNDEVKVNKVQVKIYRMQDWFLKLSPFDISRYAIFVALLVSCND